MRDLTFIVTMAYLACLPRATNEICLNGETLPAESLRRGVDDGGLEAEESLLGPEVDGLALELVVEEVALFEELLLDRGVTEAWLLVRMGLLLERGLTRAWLPELVRMESLWERGLVEGWLLALTGMEELLERGLGF